jgi:FdhD protein
MARTELDTSHSIRMVDVVRSGQAETAADHVAVEAPLEVRINGHRLAVIMRTPGRDAELALGFLLCEGLLRSREDVVRVEEDERACFVNVVFARDRSDAVSEALAARRQVTVGSACGVCGRAGLDGLVAGGRAIQAGWTIGPAIVHALPDRLRDAQSAFARTGGLHAAGLFDRGGHLTAGAEDVGRHNAVDKLIGRAASAGHLPLSDSLLLVSGRASFEIVQKAWAGGIPIVAAVSAPSSLAVDLALQAGITLLGFVRNGRFNAYAHAQRIG